MTPTRNQIIILSAVGLLVLVFVSVWLGILPGRPRNTDRPELVKATLNVWGIFNDERPYGAAKEWFFQKYPNAQIHFRGFSSQENYELTLLDALAAGKGPDIFMIPNASLDKYLNKITPAPANLSLLSMRSIFPEVVEKNFIRQGRTYALPLFIDTLALIYNKDAFNQASIIDPPSTWSELENVVPTFTKYDVNGNISQTAIALGTVENVNNASDILQLLMFQNGEINSGRSGSKSLTYYTKFSNPGNSLYTWNINQPFSVNALTQKKTAMIIDYASEVKKIKDRNPFLNIRVAPVPQTAGQNSTSYANFVGYAVSNQSRAPALAWDFIINMTTNENIAESYNLAAGEPPALLSLIKKYLNDPDWTVFSKQALSASSWQEVDSLVVDKILEKAINLVVSGKTTPENAMRAVDEEYSQAINIFSQ